MAEEEKEEVKEQEIELSENAEKVLELVSEMSVLELSRLVKALENKFDIQPMAAAVPAAGGNGGNGEEEGEEKSAYSVVLKSGGDKKIATIKAIRKVDQSLGLKEAKELVENAPKTIAEDMPAEEAKEAKKTLEEAGAEVELE
ncbi:MAG: 50S ribosomal protein L7/L12 [Patescibacteria group bacterium]|nr:50S ribosomal protein L7/L12 [Patescibacteria group bacterium]